MRHPGSPAGWNANGLGAVSGSPLRRTASSTYLPNRDEDALDISPVGGGDEEGSFRAGMGGEEGGIGGGGGGVGSIPMSGGGQGGSLGRSALGRRDPSGLGLMSSQRSTSRSRAGSWKES
jgi:hypothetical protein